MRSYCRAFTFALATAFGFALAPLRQVGPPRFLRRWLYPFAYARKRLVARARMSLWRAGWWLGGLGFAL